MALLLLISSLPSSNLTQTDLGAEVRLEQGLLLVFSEFCGGGSVQALLDGGGALEIKVAKRYGRDALHGLAYLHEQEPRVIHRDIKAANVRLTSDGRAKLGTLEHLSG